MGLYHNRPYVSRRQFLRRAAVVSGAAAAGPWFWRQLAYAAETPVSQLHLTYGRDAATEMTASWMTAEPVQQPFVEVLGTRVPARTAQYAGYPGYFHHAPVNGLSPDTDVAYAVGHAGVLVPGGDATFRTGPAGRVPFTFTAFGDQGTDQPPLAHLPTSPAPTPSWPAASSPPST